jgi:hypothetical protein
MGIYRRDAEGAEKDKEIPPQRTQRQEIYMLKHVTPAQAGITMGLT